MAKIRNDIAGKISSIQMSGVGPKTLVGGYKRLRRTYDKYSHVTVPVHILTSLLWFVSFYYTAKSGLDLVAVAESLGLGEGSVALMKNEEEAGRRGQTAAMALDMFLVATPARYLLTLTASLATHRCIRGLDRFRKGKPAGHKRK